MVPRKLSAKNNRVTEKKAEVSLGETLGHVDLMGKTALIKLDQPISSENRFLGPFIVLVKKFIRKAIGWYIHEPVYEINVHNEHAAQAVRGLTQNVIENDARLNSLESELPERVRRLERRTEDLGEAKPARDAKSSVALPSLGSSAPSDIDYYLFEHRFRESRDDIRTRQEGYAAYFSGCGKVLDAGCGRGEFLEVLRTHKIDAYGIDLNLDMVQACRDQGLQVEQADLLGHLASLPEKSLGGIFLSQVVEHLTAAELSEFVHLAYEKLKKEGVLLIETVNPMSLSVFARSFYLDPTHIKPVHPEAIKFLLQSNGFSDIEVEFQSPIPPDEILKELDVEDLSEKDSGFLLTYNANIKKLNDLLYSYQDYAVIARRPSMKMSI